MKYLRKFDSVSDMETTIASSEIGIIGLAYNNDTPVMRIKSGGSPVPPTPSTSTPFYVENISNEVETLTITQSGNYETPFIIEKSTDKTNWTTLGEVSFENSLTLSINPGDKVYLRAELNCWYLTIGGGIRRSWYSSYIGGVSKVGGNVMSLIYGSNFTGNETAFPEETVNNLAYLLSGWTPEGAVFNTTLIDASELLLPATTLAEGCYANMFSACTSLTTAPELPATTLATSCYSGMFMECTSLTAAPALPATTLAEGCYGAMFSNCTSLTTAPTLPATTLVNACYSMMFGGCTSLNSITIYANDISATNPTHSWVSNVAQNGTFHNLGSATYESGVNGIPSGWTEVHS